MKRLPAFMASPRDRPGFQLQAAGSRAYFRLYRGKIGGPIRREKTKKGAAEEDDDNSASFSGSDPVCITDPNLPAR
jgi:hypothetical protein